MKQILKYKLTDEVMRIPRSATPLCVKCDTDGYACLWAEVDTDGMNDKRDALVQVYGTGHDMDGVFEQYMGTFLQGPFVWHAYFRWLKH